MMHVHTRPSPVAQETALSCLNTTRQARSGCPPQALVERATMEEEGNDGLDIELFDIFQMASGFDGNAEHRCACARV